MSDTSAGWAVILMAAAVVFGAVQYSRADDLQSQLNQAHAQISEMKDRAQALQEASDQLQSQMDRFQSENWRDVVPDAQSASDDVASAQGALKSSADDADGGD